MSPPGRSTRRISPRTGPESENQKRPRLEATRSVDSAARGSARGLAATAWIGLARPASSNPGMYPQERTREAGKTLGQTARESALHREVDHPARFQAHRIEVVEQPFSRFRAQPFGGGGIPAATGDARPGEGGAAADFGEARLALVHGTARPRTPWGAPVLHRRVVFAKRFPGRLRTKPGPGPEWACQGRSLVPGAPGHPCPRTGLGCRSSKLVRGSGSAALPGGRSATPRQLRDQAEARVQSGSGFRTRRTRRLPGGMLAFLLAGRSKGVRELGWVRTRLAGSEAQSARPGGAGRGIACSGVVAEGSMPQGQRAQGPSRMVVDRALPEVLQPLRRGRFARGSLPRLRALARCASPWHRLPALRGAAHGDYRGGAADGRRTCLDAVRRVPQSPSPLRSGGRALELRPTVERPHPSHEVPPGPRGGRRRSEGSSPGR